MKYEKYQLSKNEVSHLAFWANLNGTTLQEEIDSFFAPKEEKEIPSHYSINPNDTESEVFEKLKKEYWGRNRDLHKSVEEPIKNMDEIKDWSTLLDLLIEE
jgi:hypothetical protein